MVCNKCGKEIPEKVKFCPYCGASQQSEPTETPEAPTIQSSKEEVSVTKSSKKKSKKMYLLAGGLTVAVACIIAAVLIIQFYQPTIRLDKYIRVKYSGYDTVGTAELSFDKKKFSEDYSKLLLWEKARTLKKNKSEMSDTDYKHAQDLESKTFGEDFFAYYVEARLNTTEKLSNGDKITCSFKCDEDLIQNIFDCKIDCDDTPLKVSGLKRVTDLDPFEEVDVTFEGISPYAKINFKNNYSDSAHESLSFEMDKPNEFKNGDKVTIKVAGGYEGDTQTYFLLTFGKKLTPMEKEYTVENLDEYADTVTDISEDTIQQINNSAQKIFEHQNSLGGHAKLTDFSYLGPVFFSKVPVTEEIDTEGGYPVYDYDEYNNEEDDYGQYTEPTVENKLYLVYKATVSENVSSGKKKYNKKRDLYWYIAFSDIVIKADGTNNIDLNNKETAKNNIEDETNIFLKGASSPFTFTLYGFESTDALRYNLNEWGDYNYNCEDQIQ